MTCPDCGAEVTWPDKPGPVTGCECGWYRVGAMKDADVSDS